MSEIADKEDPLSPVALHHAEEILQEAPQTKVEPAPSGGWLGRIREALGLAPTTTLRDDLEAELERDDALDATFTPEERAMLRNILELKETKVADVMVPRADISAVDASITLGDLLKVYHAIGHSRLPVYRDELDDAVGMVHIKDVMTWLVTKATSGATLDLTAVSLETSLADSGIIRRTLYVPSFMMASDLLRRMQASHIQMALVVDEYGGIDGLVSLEDLVETIVGDIDDEHDDDAGPDIVSTAPGIFTADARTTLEDTAATLGPTFTVDYEEEDVDTIGGYLVTLLGRIPTRGEFLAFDDIPGFVFEVLDADQRRLKRLQIYAPEAVGTAEERKRWRDVVAVAAKP